ncbi:hypothetical protein M422DRAFT_274453 [Sphaerobolus stellatus SS14]|uniref:Uncharacterized protein n=1 Tax=Sphaerobolus stellatus (strain SS14) TaxID=990650 RepID=A0A0C9TS41_SPHS4|nr:hypothetical protein M422DRAFT_274453 [Sphaerobolus stellatus SS14]
MPVKLVLLSLVPVSPACRATEAQQNSAPRALCRCCATCLLYDMIFGTAPYERNTDAKMYSKLITFISEEKWPPILLIDPWHREKTEALKFIKRFLVLSTFTRIAWHEIEEHPWIKDGWHKIHRRLPLYTALRMTNGFLRVDGRSSCIIDTVIEVAFRCQRFYLSRSIPEYLMVEGDI